MNVALIILLLVILFILAWALFGKEDLPEGKEKPSEPDVLLRRRATDREIEKKYPDERPSQMRRKSDIDSLGETREVDADFKLPYSADETISETSRFRVYHRTLVNAEIYAQKGDFNTAISLYEGVNNRINDAETNHKIEADVDYLRHYRQFLAMRNRQKEESLSLRTEPRKKGREIKLSVDGPFNIPEKIQIGITAPIQQAPIDLDKMAEEISRKLRDQRVGGEASVDDSARLKSHIDRLEGKIDRLTEAREVTEASQRPTIIEAKYESPVPLILDPQPILDLLEKIPRSGRAKDESREKAAPTDKRPGGPPSVTDSEENRLERVTRKDEEEIDEWELLSRYGKDEEQPAEEMTDEDIFAKILTEDKKKDVDDYEILGDKKHQDEISYDVIDRAKEQQAREDESFYRKFLKHNKRLARELPILKVSFDFSKLPDEFSLAREKNILEYSYYKYKPMLERADQFIKKRKVKDAINYYKVVMAQNIPPEFKIMIRKNINDLTEYLEKYLSSD